MTEASDHAQQAGLIFKKLLYEGNRPFYGGFSFRCHNWLCAAASLYIDATKFEHTHMLVKRCNSRTIRGTRNTLIETHDISELRPDRRDMVILLLDWVRIAIIAIQIATSLNPKP